MDIYLLGVYCHKNRIQELKLQHADAEFRIQNGTLIHIFMSLLSS